MVRKSTGKACVSGLSAMALLSMGLYVAAKIRDFVDTRAGRKGITASEDFCIVNVGRITTKETDNRDYGRGNSTVPIWWSMVME